MRDLAASGIRELRKRCDDSAHARPPELAVGSFDIPATLCARRATLRLYSCVCEWPFASERLIMEAGIVGLPNVGKSTLFNAMTAAGIASENYPFCTIEPNIGAVPIPDPRLTTINKYIETEKIIPAIFQLVDIAGLVRGASQGEGLGNKFLGNLRSVDAILHVVRCYEDENVVHVEGSVDPLRDIETIDTELMLADMQSLEGMIDRARKTFDLADRKRSGDWKSSRIARRCLNAGKPVRALSYEDPTSAKILRELQFITSKRVLYVANVGEEDLGRHESARRESSAACGGRRQRGGQSRGAARGGNCRAG